MASNNDNPDEPQLVDLLYDDELDEKTTGRLRSRIQSSSPEDAAELEAYEQLLERVRETDTDEKVSSELHDSIVDTARKYAEQRTEEAAHPEDRTPPPSGRQHTQTIWNRVSSGTTLTRVGTAAAALLACGTILYVMRGEVTPPGEPPAEKTTNPATSTEGVSETTSEPSDMPDPAKKSSVAEAPEPEETSDDSKSEESSKNALEMIRGDDSHESSVSDQPTSADEADEDSRVRRRQPTPPAPNDETSSSPKPKPTEQNKKRAALDDAPQPNSGRSKDQSGEIIDSFGGGGGAESAKSRTNDDAPSVASKSEGTGKAERSDDKDTQAVGPSENPLADVETNYLKNNWAETVKGVDRLLASDLEPSDEARALELKGRALEQQDKTREAHSVFSTLAERFPDYKSSVIESALERTKQEGKDDPAASRDTNNNNNLNIIRGD